MPALSGLTSRLGSDPQWTAVYGENLPKAQSVAAKIPLLHVSGRFIAFHSFSGRAFDLSTTDDDPNGYSSPKTREAEIKLDLPSCLYFYAGRAYFEFGPIVLAFPPTCEITHSGSATPFDTGGFSKNYIVWNFSPADDSTLKNFTTASLFNLGNWRDAFATYLAAYFNPLESYWTGRPWRNDPDGLFDARNEWRAWIFEVRFYEKQSILEAAAWCARPDQSEVLWREVEEMAALGSVNSPLQRFLETTTEIQSGGTRYYCEAMEEWTRAQVGL